MFSFHKPRVYRSTQGCCICKAKSSSSRFTDSKKYETDFTKCFQLETPRQGEICNACVLLVKRFKRLPAGSERHWGHVVDARVGPGLKSMTKFKKRKEESSQQNSNSKSACIPEKFSKIFRKNKNKKDFVMLKDEIMPVSSEELSIPPSPTSLHSDNEDGGFNSRTRLKKHRPKSSRKAKNPRKRLTKIDSVSFFDEAVWMPVNSCCGTVYEHRDIRAVIMDYEFCSPCPDHMHLYKPESNSIGNKMNGNKSYNNEYELEGYREPSAFKRHMDAISSSQSACFEQEANTHGNGISSVIDLSKINVKTPIQTISLKTDLTKTLKNSLEKIVNAKLKPKNFVKICAEKRSRGMSLAAVSLTKDGNSVAQNQIDPTASKFSDNSSDSGYEEIVQDQQRLSLAQNENSMATNQPKLQTIVRPVILANGVKLHVQPQNLVLAANLAGMSNTHKMTQIRTDDRAIFNGTAQEKSASKNLLAGVEIKKPSSSMLHAISVANLKQKILITKNYNHSTSK